MPQHQLTMVTQIPNHLTLAIIEIYHERYVKNHAH